MEIAEKLKLMETKEGMRADILKGKKCKGKAEL